jgi:hypothetical protein
MKTRKIIIGLTIILILLLVGFLTEFLKAQENNKISKEAADFNNQIVISQSYISDKIERLDDLFNEVSTKKEAIELLDITSNEVTLEIEKVEGLNSPQQSDEFKQSVLSLYTNYLDILENKYRNQIIPLFFEELKNFLLETI